MAMCSVLEESIPQAEAKVMQGGNPAVPRSKAPVDSGDGCFRGYRGGVLMQDQGEGLQPIKLMNKALKLEEQHYSAYERELATAYCFF